jgi:hypothetical protein
MWWWQAPVTKCACHPPERRALQAANARRAGPAAAKLAVATLAAGRAAQRPHAQHPVLAMRATSGTPAAGDVACESSTTASKAATSVRSRMLEVFYNQEAGGSWWKECPAQQGVAG